MRKDELDFTIRNDLGDQEVHLSPHAYKMLLTTLIRTTKTCDEAKKVVQGWGMRQLTEREENLVIALEELEKPLS